MRTIVAHSLQDALKEVKEWTGDGQLGQNQVQQQAGGETRRSNKRSKSKSATIEEANDKDPP